MLAVTYDVVNEIQGVQNGANSRPIGTLGSKMFAVTYDVVNEKQEPILRLLNLHLQRQHCT
jgi:hypothetical protein